MFAGISVSSVSPMDTKLRLPAADAGGPAAELVHQILLGLLDDLNTPVCISALSAPLKAVNDLLSTKAGRKNANR